MEISKNLNYNNYEFIINNKIFDIKMLGISWLKLTLKNSIILNRKNKIRSGENVNKNAAYMRKS